MGFSHFYESWLQQHRHHLQRLLSTPRHQYPATTEAAQQQQQLLRPLVEAVLAHYDSYFENKARHAKLDALDIAAGDWATLLEAAFMWVAGWRPTTAFHVFYTESGARFEAHLGDILRGLRSEDLGDISPAQLARVGELQLETVRQENFISKEMGWWQESIGEPLINFDEKIHELEMIIGKADKLRMRTLRHIVAILNPLQAVDFLVAAGQLQIGIHEWGRETGGRRGQQSSSK